MISKGKIVRGIILAVLLVSIVVFMYSIITNPLGEHDVIPALVVAAGFIILNKDKEKRKRYAGIEKRS